MIRETRRGGQQGQIWKRPEEVVGYSAACYQLPFPHSDLLLSLRGCYLSSSSPFLLCSLLVTTVMALSQSPRKVVPLAMEDEHVPRPKPRTAGSNVTRRVFFCGVVVEGTDSGRELPQGVSP